MKGLGISVPPLHAGVRLDLEALLAAFKAKNSVRFEAFAECFAALKMSLLFAGRQSAAELIEFEEHLLQLCAAYMMSVKSGEIAGYPEKFESEAKPDIPQYERSDRPPEHLPYSIPGMTREAREDDSYVSTLVERIFGIYCCYSFFYLQPKDYQAQIRISPSQLRDIMDFLDERLRAEKHLDTMACLYKLLNEGAFRITAFELTYDPACHKRYEAEDEDECCLPPGSDAPLERLKTLTEDRTMQQLEILHKRYEASKRQAGFVGVTHGEIDIADSAQRILEKAKVAIQLNEIRPLTERSGGTASAAAAAGDDPFSRLDIKKRAYASGVTASRHRRYAFADGDATVAGLGEESGEDEPTTSKGKGKKGGGGGGGGKKRGRPSRKSQREDQAEEFIQELHELGVEAVVRRNKSSPRKSISENPDAILAEFVEGTGKKRISKSEAKNMEPLVRVKKSKKEEDTDRDLARLLKQIKDAEERNKSIA